MSKRLVFDVRLPDEMGGSGAELIHDIRKDEALLSRCMVVDRRDRWHAGRVGNRVHAGQAGLAPVNALAGRTSELDATRMGQRLDLTGQPEEVLPLLLQFNALLDRLQAAYLQMSAFNADVAHELNNPLSILIGSCEVALRRPRSERSSRTCSVPTWKSFVGSRASWPTCCSCLTLNEA
jgi:two-component system heavy metal sensor histidine kinase CusS